MSKADAVTYESLSFYADKLVNIRSGRYTYFSKSADSTVNVYISIHSIAPSAVDEPLGIDEDDNTKLTFLWDTAGTGSSALSVKTNGDTDSRAVKPVRILSGKLTSLTVSNSDAAVTNYLAIGRVVTSDNTNVILRKESE